MRTAHRARSLTVAALIALGLAGSPLPASASTLAITSLDCDPRRGGFVCDAYVSGGTGVYTYTWKHGAITRSFDRADGSSIAVACESGTSRSITFGVSDTSGATASRTTIVDCY